MGYRTVVMLSNDYADKWINDPELGRKISIAMNHANRTCEPYGELGYGRVVECTHADTQTVAVLDGYDFFTPLARDGWRRGDSTDDRNLRLMKAAAEELGYRLVKKTAKKK